MLEEENQGQQTKTIKEFFKGRSDLWLLLYIPIFLAGFFLVEKLVPDGSAYWVSYCRLDDMIPFDARFVIFYALWAPLIFAVGIFLLIYDVPVFKYYMQFFIIGFTLCLIFYVLVPNGQDLRPTVFPDNDVFTRLVKLIYTSDTNTNVFPSMHVYGAIGAALGLIKSRRVKKSCLWMKPVSAVLAILISVSTCFIKQHSVLDVASGVILAAIIYTVLLIISHYKRNIS